MELPKHLRDPDIERIVRETHAQQREASEDVPTEHVLKNSSVSVGKEYDPVSNRWFTTLRIRPRRGKGDTEYVLQLDSMAAESTGNALIAAAKVEPPTANGGKTG